MTIDSGTNFAKEKNWLLREKYHGVNSPEYEHDRERLRQGEPLAYVIGWVDFLGARIVLDSRPLIPRPETEWWMEQAIKLITENENKKPELRILDLYAGSGCIGIALLKHLPNTHVDFGEIDTKHLEQIRKNCKTNGIMPERYRLIQTDDFSNITDTYDYIFANPPYIDPALGNVDASVLVHEPKEALFAEDGGFFHIHRLLSEGAKHLSLHGSLFIEFSPEQRERIRKEAQQLGWLYDIRRDQYEKARWVILGHSS